MNCENCTTPRDAGKDVAKSIAAFFPQRREAKPTILFCGGLEESWMSGWQRCQALKELGHNVVEFPHGKYIRCAENSKPRRFLTGRHYREAIVDEFNADLSAALARSRPDVVWMEWPVLLRHETIQTSTARYPGCTWVSFQDDNPFGTRSEEKGRWSLFLETIPRFDLNLVKRVGDLEEFRRRGSRRTIRFMHGFYAPLFRPLTNGPVSESSRQPASFVGTALDHRIGFITQLLNEHRLPLRIYGNKWNRTWCYFKSRDSFGPPVVGEEYVRVIVGSKINLGFVSSSNHDEYSMRTFEIPACGGFFLAERTPTHLELFREGKEAEFFGSVEECADKMRFYLKNESLRSRIAEDGYRRCIDSDYSLHRRMSEAVNQIRLLKM